MRGGSSPDLVFSDRFNGEQQADVIYHEYTHAVIYKLHDRNVGSSGQGAALGEAVAFYFPQSFLDDPRQESGTPDEYDLLFNLRKYPRDYNNTTSAHQRGLIAAGAAWDLRADIGATKTDKIIFAAMEMDSPRANTFEEFYDNVLLADDDLYGNGTWNWQGCSQGGDKSPHAGEIWKAFDDNHGMPSSLLDEDPDCPSSKPQAQGAAADAVEGAYPNPFNSSVHLRYHLDEPGRVEVAVYSTTGQLIRRLSSHEQAQPGSYLVVWDGQSDGGTPVASGVYFVRVKSPSLVKSFKLSLIR